MAGFGTSPFGGATPFGYGVPDDPGTIPTGVTSASRWINPQTGKLEIDGTTGHLKQMSRVMQQALLALRTELGSIPEAPEFGYQSPKKMTPRFESEVDAQVRSTLRHLTDVQKCMTILRLEVTRGGSARYSVVLRYRNHDTGEEEKLIHR